MNRTDAIPHAAFVRIDTPTMEDVMDPARLAILAAQCRQESNDNAMPQVRALLAAGWKYELPGDGDYDVWQWYWRSPPKRAGTRGRQYLSTNQAYNAMKRQAA